MKFVFLIVIHLLLVLKSQYLGTHLLGKFLILLIPNQVFPFMGIFFMIVQFLGTILVAEVAISFGLGSGVLRAITKKGNITGC